MRQHAKIKARRLHHWWETNYPMRPQTKSSTRKKVAEARRGEMKYFEAMEKTVQESRKQTKKLDDDP